MNRGFPLSSFIVSEETMRRAVTALDVAQPLIELDLLGRRLYALNARAVADRYGRAKAAPDYRHRPLFNATKVELFKSLECLVYQCNEGEIPETTPLYKQMDGRLKQLALEIVHALPEYIAAEWDRRPSKGYKPTP